MGMNRRARGAFVLTVSTLALTVRFMIQRYRTEVREAGIMGPHVRAFVLEG